MTKESKEDRVRTPTSEKVKSHVSDSLKQQLHANALSTIPRPLDRQQSLVHNLYVPIGKHACFTVDAHFMKWGILSFAR